MTAWYMFRLYATTFRGKFRGTEEQQHHLHESPAAMTIPLIVLAILSVVGGFIGVPEIFAQGWDRLVRETGTVGVHWEDHPAMQGLDIPEWSHLTRESATRHTRAYLEVLMREVHWLRSRVDGWRAARVP